MATNKNQYYPQIAFHPGETLGEKLKEIGMGPKEFAIRASKPEKTISAILKGKSSITPEMAVQFEHVLKIPAHFWLNMQRNYDEFVARQKRRKVLAEASEWTKKFPYADMAKKGWVAAQNSMEAKTIELLNFFGISDHHAWEKYYLEQYLKVEFRISLAHTAEPYAISAWLRKGELQAAELSANSYDEKKMKEILPELKSIMALQPQDFFRQLQACCLQAGVKVVHTPCINKAPVSGCTRWINDSPLIQLTGRYKRNDVFWFTFFHEVGHILLHGKKNIFLENVEYLGREAQKEEDADSFAINYTLSPEQESEILQNGIEHIAKPEVITGFANKFTTHPAIIIGRLQYKKLIRHSQGQQWIVPVKLD